MRETLELQTYPLPVFAALWCGVPPDDVQTVLEKSVQVGNTNARNSVLRKSADYPCLFPKMQIIMNAIDTGQLMACDETGREREGVAWHRVHISGKRGREFLREYCRTHNDELPKVFFPDIEHLPKDDELSKKLRAENEKLKSEIDDLRKRFSVADQTISMQEAQIRCLEIQISKMKNSPSIDENANELIKRLAQDKEELQRRNATFEKGTGLAFDVVRSIALGEAKESIAARLHQGGDGMSKSQIAALLFEGTSLPKENTVQSYGTSLFAGIHSKK